jgi:hypothetical protein
MSTGSGERGLNAEKQRQRGRKQQGRKQRRRKKQVAHFAPFAAQGEPYADPGKTG